MMMENNMKGGKLKWKMENKNHQNEAKKQGIEDEGETERGGEEETQKVPHAHTTKGEGIKKVNKLEG